VERRAMVAGVSEVPAVLCAAQDMKSAGVGAGAPVSVGAEGSGWCVAGEAWPSKAVSAGNVRFGDAVFADGLEREGSVQVRLLRPRGSVVVELEVERSAEGERGGWLEEGVAALLCNGCAVRVRGSGGAEGGRGGVVRRARCADGVYLQEGECALTSTTATVAWRESGEGEAERWRGGGEERVVGEERRRWLAKAWREALEKLVAALEGGDGEKGGEAAGVLLTGVHGCGAEVVVRVAASVMEGVEVRRMRASALVSGAYAGDVRRVVDAVLGSFVPRSGTILLIQDLDCIFAGGSSDDALAADTIRRVDAVGSALSQIRSAGDRLVATATDLVSVPDALLRPHRLAHVIDISPPTESHRVRSFSFSPRSRFPFPISHFPLPPPLLLHHSHPPFLSSMRC
jgi:ATPase family associated with various cellular activities (AAA)